MRLLHWLMAAMVLTMLGIGVAMVASLGDYHRLVSIHRPLGIMILILVVVPPRDAASSSLPPFPATMSPQERFVAHALGSSVVYVAVCRAARRMGHVVGRAISDCPVRVTASFSHPSAQRDAVRGLAEDAHASRLSPIPRIRRPFWGRDLSHAGGTRPATQPHATAAGPRALTSSKRHSSWPATARRVTSSRCLLPKRELLTGSGLRAMHNCRIVGLTGQSLPILRASRGCALR